MGTEVYWIPTGMPGRLAIMPRPRGGDWLDDEVRSWRSQGIDVVLSLLTPAELVEMDLSQEDALCKAHGIEYQAFPIVDRGVPTSKAAVLRLTSDLAEKLAQGKGVAIHCRQGIGRAPLLAIAILALTGISLESAIAKVGTARGFSVPETREQEHWLAEFVKTLPVSAPK